MNDGGLLCLFSRQSEQLTNKHVYIYTKYVYICIYMRKHTPGKPDNKQAAEPTFLSRILHLYRAIHSTPIHVANVFHPPRTQSPFIITIYLPHTCVYTNRFYHLRYVHLGITITLINPAKRFGRVLSILTRR